MNRLLKEADKDTEVYSWDVEVSNELERRKLDYKLISEDDYSEKIGTKWLKSIAKKNFSKKRNLINLFDFKGISLWWGMEYWLFFSYAFHDSFRDTLKIVWVANKFLEKEKPDKIIFANQGLLKDNTITLVAKSKKIETKRINATLNRLKFSLKKASRLSLIRSFFLTRYVLRKTILNIILKKSGNKKTRYKDNVLFVSKHSHRTKEFLEPITENLKDMKYNRVFLDIPSNEIVLNLKVFREKLKEEDSWHILLENYLAKRDIREIDRTTKKFKRMWKQLKRNNSFKNLFIYENNNLWSIVEPQLSCFFDIRLKEYIKEMVAVENVIDKIRPKVAVNFASAGFDDALIASCQKRKIPTVILLYGVINEITVNYDKDQVSGNEIKAEKFLIPTKTVVCGENYKRALVNKGHYPEDSIVVTGDMRYDPIINMKFDKKEICKQIGLDPNKKIILFGTFDAPLMKDREILTKVVGESVEKIKDVQLLIKPHPNETKGFYEKIVNKYKIKAVVAEGNIFPFLYISDVLLMVNSTIGLEAAIFNKPFINMTFICNLDMWNYAKKGLALEAKEAKELPNMIKKVLYDKKTREELAKNRKKYVYDQCYKIDGNSKKRIAEVIKKAIKNK